MTKQKQETLEINLNEIKNPHKEVLRGYKEGGAEGLHFMHIPAYVNEERVWLQSAASSKPIRHLITHLYRVQHKGKEYCYFGEELFTEDYFGNQVQHFRTVGKYEKPIINKTMGLNPALLKSNTNINEMMQKQAKEVSIDHMETVLEFPWEDIKPQLSKWKNEGIITDETQLYIIAGQNEKLSAPYTWSQWYDLDFDDAVLVARAGRRFISLLKDQIITPQILDTLRTKLAAEVISEISKK